MQIRLLQMLLGQLGNGWESIQDSFMISILGFKAATSFWDFRSFPEGSYFLLMRVGELLALFEEANRQLFVCLSSTTVDGSEIQ